MKKMWIIFGVFILSAIIGGGIYFIVRNNVAQSPKEVIDEIDYDIIPQIDCEDISLFKNELQNISYTITCLTDYDLEITSNFEQVIIENKSILVTQEGEFSFDIKVTVNQKVYSKNVKIFCFERITDVACDIYDQQQNQVDKLFVGNSYYAIFTTQNKIRESFLSLTENLSNIEISATDFSVKVNFKVQSYGESKFIFSSFDFEKEFIISTYQYIDNFDVTFDRTLIYYFNTEYLQQAQNDGYFNYTTFNCDIDSKCLNDYSITLLNQEVIKLENNKITALKNGSCEVVFSANDGGGYSKSYTITVMQINLQNLQFNLNSVEIKTNEKHKVEYTYSPVYAICNLTFDLTLDDNGEISFSSAGNYILNLTDTVSNLQASMQFVVTEEINYCFELIFNQSFLENYNATYQNDTLTLNLKQNNEIYFSYNIVPTYSGQILCNIEILNNQNNLDIQSQNISNAVVLTFTGVGSFDVKLTLKDNSNIEYILHIVTQ